MAGTTRRPSGVRGQQDDHSKSKHQFLKKGSRKKGSGHLADPPHVAPNKPVADKKEVVEVPIGTVVPTTEWKQHTNILWEHFLGGGLEYYQKSIGDKIATEESRLKTGRLVDKEFSNSLKGLRAQLRGLTEKRNAIRKHAFRGPQQTPEFFQQLEQLRLKILYLNNPEAYEEKFVAYNHTPSDILEKIIKETKGYNTFKAFLGANSQKKNDNLHASSKVLILSTMVDRLANPHDKLRLDGKALTPQNCDDIFLEVTREHNASSDTLLKIAGHSDASAETLKAILKHENCNEEIANIITERLTANKEDYSEEILTSIIKLIEAFFNALDGIPAENKSAQEFKNEAEQSEPTDPSLEFFDLLEEDIDASGQLGSPELESTAPNQELWNLLAKNTDALGEPNSPNLENTVQGGWASADEFNALLSKHERQEIPNDPFSTQHMTNTELEAAADAAAAAIAAEDREAAIREAKGAERTIAGSFLPESNPDEVLATEYTPNDAKATQPRYNQYSAGTKKSMKYMPMKDQLAENRSLRDMLADIFSQQEEMRVQMQKQIRDQASLIKSMERTQEERAQSAVENMQQYIIMQKKENAALKDKIKDTEAELRKEISNLREDMQEQHKQHEIHLRDAQKHQEYMAMIQAEQQHQALVIQEVHNQQEQQKLSIGQKDDQLHELQRMGQAHTLAIGQHHQDVQHVQGQQVQLSLLAQQQNSQMETMQQQIQRLLPLLEHIANLQQLAPQTGALNNIVLHQFPAMQGQLAAMQAQPAAQAQQQALLLQQAAVLQAQLDTAEMMRIANQQITNASQGNRPGKPKLNM